MKKLLLLTTCILMTACASKYKVEKIEANITPKGQLSAGQTVGLNDSGEAIIQQRTKASEELRGLIWHNNESERELNSESYDLRRCRYEMADPRLGGNGEVVDIPAIDNMKDVSEVREKMGLIDEDLMIVKEEYLQDRLKSERSYGKTLSSMLTKVKDYKEKCEYKLGFKRVKAGLPSEVTVIFP